MRLPLIFIPNQGQVDAQVAYYAQGPGGTVYVTSTGLVLDLIRRAPPSRRVSLPPRDQPAGPARRLTIRQTFPGATPHPTITGFDRQAGRVNYIRGRDPAGWRAGLPAYGGVTYHDLYPGIDLRYTGTPGRLKYEFLIAPGTDYTKVQVAYAGIEGLRLTEAGDLVIATAEGELSDARPVSYQVVAGRKVTVASRIRLINGRTYGFEVTGPGPGYDPRYPLVIDPGLVYSTYVGSPQLLEEQADALVVDAAGNVYVSGYTAAANFPVTPGAAQSSSRGRLEIVVFKLNPTGTSLVYATYLGGTGDDSVCSALAVDASGAAYVAGWTTSADFPTTAGAFSRSYHGGNDAFVAKLNPAGSALVYSTYLGGSGFDDAYAFAVDASGALYLTGDTTSPDFPTTPGALSRSLHGTQSDGYVAKLSPDGSSLVYATYLGGSGFDSSRGLGIDAGGNVYVTGYTDSTDFPVTPGAVQSSIHGLFDLFVAKLNPTGSSLVYATYLGGSKHDFSRFLTVDASGAAYVVGYTQSPDFPTTAGAFSRSYHGGSDAFVVKLNPDGTSLVYATYLGGSGYEDGWALAVDAAGAAYVTGLTQSADFPTTAGAFALPPDPINGDAYVVKLDPTGSSLVYATRFGGSGFEKGRGIAVDAAGSVYIAGVTNSPDFPTTPGVVNRSCCNSFVMKLALAAGLGDSTPPTVPTGLTAVTAGNGQISLTWTASTDNVEVTAYRIYRNGAQVGTAKTTSYTDTGLAGATTYTYTVAACDASSNCSAQSASATAQAGGLADTTPPTVPTDLKATALIVSDGEVTLSWTASTDNVGVTAYKIYRNGALVATTTATRYTDAGLSGTTTYTYTVAACDASGNCSAQSASVTPQVLRSNVPTASPPGSTSTPPPATTPAAQPGPVDDLKPLSPFFGCGRVSVLSDDASRPEPIAQILATLLLILAPLWAPLGRRALRRLSSAPSSIRE